MGFDYSVHMFDLGVLPCGSGAGAVEGLLDRLLVTAQDDEGASRPPTPLL